MGTKTATRGREKPTEVSLLKSAVAFKLLSIQVFTSSELVKEDPS